MGAGASNRLLSELDRLYRAPLQRFFRNRGCAPALAQDLTQDVFVRTIAYQRDHEIANLKAFIFQSAANLLRDAAKSAKRWMLTPLDEGGADAAPLIDPITPERIVEGRQDLRAVSNALGMLDPRTRRIFMLCRIEQLRHGDIAKRLGLSVSLTEKSVRGAHRFLEAERRRLGAANMLREAAR